ncbi:MAG: hypothetical protein ABI700_04605 [Chloroflexota bacterium]
MVEGAELNTRRVPSRFAYATCATSYEPVGADFRCPTCGSIGQITDEGRVSPPGSSG